MASSIALIDALNPENGFVENGFFHSKEDTYQQYQLRNFKHTRCQNGEVLAVPDRGSQQAYLPVSYDDGQGCCDHREARRGHACGRCREAQEGQEDEQVHYQVHGHRVRRQAGRVRVLELGEREEGYQRSQEPHQQEVQGRSRGDSRCHEGRRGPATDVRGPCGCARER